MRKAQLSLFVPLGAILLAHGASAGVYTDELSKCMVESTTAGDRTDLVRWMFSAAASHPAVKPLATVSPQQLSEANTAMGSLLTRLLSQNCLDPARKAFRYEGAVALQMSMQLLGQVAGQELFTNPEVASALSGMDSSFDADKIRALLEAE